ncbi:hypothetical protein ACOSQ3_016350 [Xanthoceras sorbifolium]
MAHTPGPPHQLFPLVVCHVARVVEPLTVRWTVANPTKFQQSAQRLTVSSNSTQITVYAEPQHVYTCQTHVPKLTLVYHSRALYNEAVKVERLEARPHPNTCPNPPAVAGHLRNQPSQQPRTVTGNLRAQAPSQLSVSPDSGSSDTGA